MPPDTTTLYTTSNDLLACAIDQMYYYLRNQAYFFFIVTYDKQSIEQMVWISFFAELSNMVIFLLFCVVELWFVILVSIR